MPEIAITLIVGFALGYGVRECVSADGAKRSGSDMPSTRIPLGQRLSLFHRRAGMASPARQPNTWVASMTSRDGYIWFAVALAIAIVVLACIAIWTGSAPT